MEWVRRYGGLHEKGAKPFKADGTPSRQLLIALLFVEGKAVKLRRDILTKVGVDKEKAKTQGYNSSLFQTLTYNQVIKYDTEKRVYVAGSKHKEFLKYCAEYMVLKGFHKKKRKVYLTMMRESSQAMHFILE